MSIRDTRRWQDRIDKTALGDLERPWSLGRFIREGQAALLLPRIKILIRLAAAYRVDLNDVLTYDKHYRSGGR